MKMLLKVIIHQSVSSLTDLINHNKKIATMYKNVSEIKSRDLKKNF